MWWSIVELLYDNELITNIQSLYALDTPEQKLKAMTLEGIWTIKWEKIVSSLVDSKNKEFSEILYWIGILWIWKKLAKTLTQYYSQQIDSECEDLYKCFFTLNSQEKLVGLYGIGTELSHSICKRTQRPQTKDLINSLEQYWVLTVEKLSNTIQNESDWWIFLWKTVVITGGFEMWRKKLSQRIESAWWSITSAVSSATDYLIVWNKPWGKVQKAKELWVSMIIWDDINNYIEDKSLGVSVKSTPDFTQQNLF
jgi:NAD-dependent DNA ligase